MKREFYLYLTAFLLSVALAFWASIPMKDKDPERKAVLSIAGGQIGEITFTSPEATMKVSKNSDGKWWVKSDKAGVKERFLTSSKIEETLALLNPLEAIRVIGKVKDEQLAEYGLGDSKKTLGVTDTKGGELIKLTIGKQAYGSRNVFAKESRENSVILLSGDFVGDFERPDLKLYERTITAVAIEEVEGATVTQGAKTRKLVHSKRDEKGSLVWTADTADGANVVSAKSWFERLDRIRVVSYSGAEEIAVLEKLTPIFQVELDGQGSSGDILVFAKKEGLSPAPDAKTVVTDYFVKSKHLGTWAKVGSTRVEPIEKDLPTIMGQ